MKNPLEKINQLARNRRAEKEDLKEAIYQLKEQIADTKARGRAAAGGGDLNGYQEAQREAADLEDKLAVNELHLETLDRAANISNAEAAQAWTEYSAQYNKTFAAKLGQYKNKREDLLSFFRELINLQAEALETRAWLAKEAGIDTAAASIFDKPLDVAFPMLYLPDRINANPNTPRLTLNGTNIQDADALFYMANLAAQKQVDIHGFIADPEIQLAHNVISRHSTKPYS